MRTERERERAQITHSAPPSSPPKSKRNRPFNAQQGRTLALPHLHVAFFPPLLDPPSPQQQQLLRMKKDEEGREEGRVDRCQSSIFLSLFFLPRFAWTEGLVPASFLSGVCSSSPFPPLLPECVCSHNRSTFASARHCDGPFNSPLPPCLNIPF